ncbi:unnamed protein product [Notodromas monacha]|uniref:Aldehyde dehydrogenase domain-containing protein n=1 Tax=Notodromas monacha TaxID=399045 RepID=A0A7R9BLD1_9CRUS|nr:unnamed protein product [Notodromas monacha]CAG0916821.1 unnamed protein product [Notodromas monacha]
MSEMNGSAVKSAVPVSDGRQTPTSTSSSPTASFNDTSDTNGILQQQQQGSPPPSDAVIRTETAAPAPINFATIERGFYAENVAIESLVSFLSSPCAQVVNDLRTTFQSGKTKDVSFRIQQLKALQRMLKENEMKIVETVQKDLRKASLIFRQISFHNQLCQILPPIEKELQTNWHTTQVCYEARLIKLFSMHFFGESEEETKVIKNSLERNFKRISFHSSCRLIYFQPAMEIRGSEIDFCVNEIEVMLHNIHDWTKEKRVPKCMVTLFDKPSRRPEPYGVALVMGAWNYPVSLTFTPVTGAIAAGNCVVIKPSDVAPNTAQLFSELISKYLDSSCYKVVCGGVAETTDLLKQRFDYIFFTGGYRVGKIVREASNRHLTPCTLELGGKSPVYLDDSVNNMDIAVKRIIWGKLVNAGQSCIAPDYMLCTREVQDIFVNKARELIKEFFGNKPQESASFGRIINNSHFQRLTGLLHSGVVAVGGDVDPSDLYIAPTILVMQFGLLGQYVLLYKPG